MRTLSSSAEQSMPSFLKACASNMLSTDRSRPGPAVTGDHPEVSFLGGSAAGIEHRRDGLVDRDIARAANQFA
jgi:hypothetical protein